MGFNVASRRTGLQYRRLPFFLAKTIGQQGRWWLQVEASRKKLDLEVSACAGCLAPMVTSSVTRRKYTILCTA